MKKVLDKAPRAWYSRGRMKESKMEMTVTLKLKFSSTTPAELAEELRRLAEEMDLWVKSAEVVSLESSGEAAPASAAPAAPIAFASAGAKRFP